MNDYKKLVNPVTHADRAITLIDQYNQARILDIASDSVLSVRQHFSIARTFTLPVHRYVTSPGIITLAETPTVNSYDILLTAGHGLVGGEQIALVQDLITEQQFVFTKVISVSNNTATLCCPMPYPFDPAETTLYTFITDMVVNGSSDYMAFVLYNAFEQRARMTQFSIHITDVTAMDDGKFGGIPALTRGIILRKKKLDGTYVNYFNFRTNGDMIHVSETADYNDNAPGGIYGLHVEINLENFGSIIQALHGEEVQVLIQDDMTGLDSFTTTICGHFY